MLFTLHSTGKCIAIIWFAMWLWCYPTQEAQGQSDTLNQKDRSDSSSIPGLTFTISSATYFQPGALGQDYLAPTFRSSFEDYSATSQLHSDPYYYYDYLNERSVADNPLPHVAGYVRASATVRPFAGLSIMGGIVAENRGMSYGTNSISNSAVVPVVFLSLDTTIDLGMEPIRLRFMLGDFVDRRIDEGLTVYNMDWQGGILELIIGALTLRYEKGADGWKGIGLNAEDLDHYSIGLDSLASFGNWNLSARSGAFYYLQRKYNPYPVFTPRGRKFADARLDDFGYTLSAALADRENRYRLYGEAGLRSAATTTYFLNQLAWLGGVKGEGELAGCMWNGRLEYRYYGGLFNANYRNDDVYYRDPDGPAYSNTVGPSLYSITRFDRPFSQWAVFTEYQDLKNVMGLSAYVLATRELGHHFILRTMLDLNYIKAEGVAGYLYPFYDMGIGWQPVDRFSIVASATNRGMDLDKSYPALYLYSHPWLQFAIRWNTEVGGTGS